MARCKYGALVTEIRGSVGGSTFQNNAQGFSLKNKGYQKNPRTSSQIARRSNLIQAIRMWQQMQPAERQNCESWCAAYPQYAKNDPTKLIKAYNVFLRCQSIYNLFEIEALGAPFFAPRTIEPFTFSVAVDNGFLYISVNNSQSIESNHLFFFLSRPISPTQNFQRTQTRYIFHTYDDDQYQQCGSEYFSAFGMIPIENDIIFLRVVFIGAGTLQCTTVYFGKVTVTQAI